MGLCGLLLERACCGTSCASFLSEKSRVSSGIVALILRDAKAKGIWTICREIGIPTELASLVKAQRTKRFVGKAVLPDTAADDEGVVNFTASGIQAGGETYTAAQYAGRIAGILAGTPADCSATYAALSEVTGAAAVENPDATVEDEYLGRCANSCGNKCILLTAFRDFPDSLDAQSVLAKDALRHGTGRGGHSGLSAGGGSPYPGPQRRRTAAGEHQKPCVPRRTCPGAGRW